MPPHHAALPYAAEIETPKPDEAEAIDGIIAAMTQQSADLDLQVLPDVGHFPHRENPDLAAREIGAFFGKIGWGQP